LLRQMGGGEHAEDSRRDRREDVPPELKTDPERLLSRRPLPHERLQRRSARSAKRAPLPLQRSVGLPPSREGRRHGANRKPTAAQGAVHQEEGYSMSKTLTRNDKVEYIVIDGADVEKA